MTRGAAEGSRTLVRTAAALFLAVQVAVPAIQLGEERPSRWGWQMFSTIPPVEQVRVERPDGVEFVALPTLLAHWRHEIRPDPPLLRRICELRPRATRVAAGSHEVACDR